MKTNKLIVMFAFGLAVVGAVGLWRLKLRTDWLLAEMPRQAAVDAAAQESILIQMGSMIVRNQTLEDEVLRNREAFRDGFAILSPPNNVVVQQRGGAAAIPVEILGFRRETPYVMTVRDPSTGNLVVPTQPVTNNLKLSVGSYDLCIEAPNGLEKCNRISVGNLFVVAGQSNAVSNSDSAHRSRTGKVFISQPERPGVFLDAGGTGLRHGVAWIEAGDLLVERYGVPVGFVIMARSSSSTRHWRPGGLLFPALQTTLASMDATAVLWHQGEADCAAGYPAKESFGNMDAMIAAAKEARQSPWFIALNTSSADRSCPVRLAQTEIIAVGAAKQGPDTDTLTKVGEHFPMPTLLDHGRLWAEKIIDEEKSLNLSAEVR